MKKLTEEVGKERRSLENGEGKVGKKEKEERWREGRKMEKKI